MNRRPAAGARIVSDGESTSQPRFFKACDLTVTHDPSRAKHGFTRGAFAARYAYLCLALFLCFSVAKPFLSLKLRSLLFELDISLVDFV